MMIDSHLTILTCTPTSPVRAARQPFEARVDDDGRRLNPYSLELASRKSEG